MRGRRSADIPESAFDRDFSVNSRMRVAGWHWDEAIRTLSNGDHYLPVLWGTAAPGEGPLRGAFTPVRKSFTLFVTGLLIAAAIIVAGFFAAKYHITLDHFRDYLPVPLPGSRIDLFLGLLMLALAGWLFFDWVLLPWVRRRAKDDQINPPECLFFWRDSWLPEILVVGRD